jgi:hypothetical protein
VHARPVVALLIVLASCLVRLLSPAPALAHDDPILTVRVLSQGITDGQVDTAMGELDDNATVLVDRPLQGRDQIRAWIEQQLVLNLRIEVIDVTPTQVGDGYQVTWTTRMYREDWRKAGVPVRQTTEQATIHNGRITRWTSSLASALAAEGNTQAASAAQAAAAPVASSTNAGFGPSIGGVPLSQVPLGLVGLVGLLVLGGAWLVIGALRRPRRAPVEPRRTIEALSPGAADRKR